MSDTNKKWRARNPEKVKAHWTINNAIRYGKIVRQPCINCGNTKSHAHHSDYSKPLDVIWLCHNCHWQIHGWVNKAKAKTKAIVEDGPKERARNTEKHKRYKLYEAALQMRNEGYEYREIAKVLNCSASTIYKCINKTKYS